MDVDVLEITLLIKLKTDPDSTLDRGESGEAMRLHVPTRLRSHLYN